MKACTKCGEQVDDRARFCPICGEALEVPPTPAGPNAEPAPQESQKTSIAMKIAAAPALLLGAFMVVVVVITYYAGMVVLFDSFIAGAEAWMGIVAATVLLVIGLVVFFVFFRRDKKK